MNDVSSDHHNTIKTNIDTPIKENNIDQKSSNATKWSLLTEIFARLATPIANMILARLLMPEAFGLVATITMVLSFAEIFTDAGFQKYIIQHEFESDKRFNDAVQVAFWSNVGLALIISLLILVFRKQIAYIVGNEELGVPIAVAGLTILFNAISSVHIGVFKREFEFKRLFWVRLAISLVPIIITVPAAYILRSFWALIIGNIVKSIVQAAIIIPSSKVGVRAFYSIEIFKDMFSFSFWTLIESVSIWLTSNIDVFIIGRILDNHYLGLYKTAISTVTTYLGIISAAITTVLFSTLSRYQNNQEKYLETYFKFQRRLAIFLLPCGVGVFVFRELVTRVLLGNNWMEISFFLGLFALLNVYGAEICYFASEVFRSKGQPQISFIYQCVFIAILSPTIYIFAKKGFFEVCMARSICYFALIGVALVFCQLLYGIRIIDIFRNIGTQSISAFIMGGCGILMLRISDAIPLQIVYIVICIGVYFVILLRFKGMKNEIMGVPIVSKMFHKARLMMRG